MRQTIDKISFKCKKRCGFKSKIKDLHKHEQKCQFVEEPVLKEEVKENQEPLEEKNERKFDVA